MFVGAVSVNYLLSAGLTLGQIASLKSAQAVIFLLADIPTGIFADTFSRRLSLIISTLFGIVGFLLFFLGSGWLWFLIAEICTALSLCFWGGAFEAYAIDAGSLSETPGLLDRFFHLSQTLNSLSVMLFGLIGGFLAANNFRTPYLGAIGSFLGCLVMLLFILPKDLPHSRARTNLKISEWKKILFSTLRTAVHEGILHPSLFPIFLAGICLQFSIQPILHYWQPLFSGIDPHLRPSTFGTIFTAYAGVTALISAAYARISTTKWARSRISTFILFLIFSTFYWILPKSGNWIIAMVIFCALQGVLATARSSLSARINEATPPAARASILSSLSFFSRLGMIAALTVIHSNFARGDKKPNEVLKLFQMFSTFSLGVCALIGLYIILRRTRKSEP